MKKIILISILGILLLQCYVLANEKKFKPGRYNCPYYAQGRDNICAIDVDWTGKASTECSFLDFKLIKMLLNSKKCTFESYKYYSCKYNQKVRCEVALGIRSDMYIVGCEGDETFRDKALNDARNGKCSVIPAAIVESNF